MKTPVNFNKDRQRSNIFNSFLTLREEIDKAFHNIFEKPMNFEASTDIGNLTIKPSIDIIEDKQNFKIEIELPGMSEEDLKVKIQNSMLIIHGEKTISRKDEDKDYVSREICYGRYERKIALPDNIDANKAKATFKKGMLWVNFPKKEKSDNQEREITVEKAAV